MKYYLYVDSNWFGDHLRLGDFTMVSCILLLIKQQIINSMPSKYTNNNVYFILNNVGGVHITRINELMQLFPNIWSTITLNKSNRYNIRQILSGGNIWAFKMYMESNNIRQDKDIAEHFNGQHVIDPRVNYLNSLTGNKKNDVFILPIRGKDYNTERNLTDTLLTRIINNVIIPHDNVYVITKDNEYRIGKYNKNVVELGDNMQWIDIIFMIMNRAKLYISGDCGMSHFISMCMPIYKPREIRLYYRTKPCNIHKPLNQFDNVHRECTFTPYMPYTTDILTIESNF